MTFSLNQPCLEQSDQKTQLFFEHGLPLITDMLKLHKTIDLLEIACIYSPDSEDEKICQSRIERAIDFLMIIFLHPTLRYTGINLFLNKNLKHALASTHNYIKENKSERTLPIIILNPSMPSIFHDSYSKVNLISE